MRQVNMRQLRAQLSSELLDLPFKITKNGEVIAVVVDEFDPLCPPDTEAFDEYIVPSIREGSLDGDSSSLGTNTVPYPGYRPVKGGG